jgi:hypothetical protein
MKINYIHINEMDEIKNHIHSVENPILLIVKEGSEGFYGRVCDKFGFIYGDEHKGLMKIINNFLSYESSAGRNPLVFLFKNAQINENDFINRADDDWVVHSTDKESLESIIKMGKLLSRIELDKQKIKYLDFGREYLNEPSDYYDLIEFGGINGSGEIVVASKTQNRFVNENEEYTPGGRIYIKLETLRKQKGYIDFLDHYCIKGTLDLTKIEYKIVIPEDLKERKWTPRIFSEEANKVFMERIK